MQANTRTPRHRPAATLVPLEGGGGISYEQAVDRYVAHQRARGARKGTVKNYDWALRGRVAQFVEERGIDSLAAFDEGSIDLLRVELRGLGLSESSVSIIERNLHSFLVFCRQHGWVGGDALTAAKPSRPQDTMPPAGLSREQERRLLAVAKRSSPRDYAMVYLMLRTGLRAGDVCGLTVDSYFPAVAGQLPAHLRIHNGKGGKDRLVPLDTAQHCVSAVLDDYLRRHRKPAYRNDHMFLATQRRRGDYQPMTTSGLFQLVQRLGDVAGIPGLHPHLLRHHFATQAVRAGVGLDALRRALGHSSLEMARKYVHANDEDLLREFATLQG